jgi:thiol-disulfide isomerase/thioredoxin
VYQAIVYKRLKMFLQPIYRWRPKSQTMAVIVSTGFALSIMLGYFGINSLLKSFDAKENTALFNIDGDKKKKLPEFSSTGIWLNSDPITIKQSKNKIVLVAFWSSSCNVCRTQLQQYQGIYDKYKDYDVEFVTIHSPEFVFEARPDYIQEVLDSMGVSAPTQLDNDYKDLDAYGIESVNSFVADSGGTVRFFNDRTLGTTQTEKVIRALIKEKDKNIKLPALNNGQTGVLASDEPLLSVDYYLNADSGKDTFRESKLEAGTSDFIFSSGTLAVDKWALNGRWKVTNDYIESESDDARFFIKLVGGREIALVAGSDSGSVIESEKQSKIPENIVFSKEIEIGRDGIYELLSSPEPIAQPEFSLKVPKGTRIYKIESRL